MFKIQNHFIKVILNKMEDLKNHNFNNSNKINNNNNLLYNLNSINNK